MLPYDMDEIPTDHVQDVMCKIVTYHSIKLTLLSQNLKKRLKVLDFFFSFAWF